MASFITQTRLVDEFVSLTHGNPFYIHRGIHRVSVCIFYNYISMVLLGGGEVLLSASERLWLSTRQGLCPDACKSTVALPTGKNIHWSKGLGSYLCLLLML